MSLPSCNNKASITLGGGTNRTRSENWCGRVPVVLTLAPSSVSSPTVPPPIHALLPRNAYMHLALRSAVLRLREFAPTPFRHHQRRRGSGNSSTASSFGGGGAGGQQKLVQNEPEAGSSEPYGGERDGGGDAPSRHHRRRTSSSVGRNYGGGGGDDDSDSDYPVCWFEDEATQMALRWQLFCGVLYDLKRDRDLPWRIRLHLNAPYPASQILPLEAGAVQAQIRSYYKNSLKQALCMQYGTNKVAMNVTKEQHGRIWEAVVSSNYGLYSHVNDNFGDRGGGGSSSLQQMDATKLVMVPVRLYVNSRPPIQKRCRCSGRTAKDAFGDDGRKAGGEFTLGQLLAEWIPDYYFRDCDDEPHQAGEERFAAKASRSTGTVRQSDSVVACRVNGIQPPLSTPVVELWQALCHPDHFLYVLVLTN